MTTVMRRIGRLEQRLERRVDEREHEREQAAHARPAAERSMDCVSDWPDVLQVPPSKSSCAPPRGFDSIVPRGLASAEDATDAQARDARVEAEPAA